MFSAPVILIIFTAAFLVTLRKNVGATFAYVLMPVLLCLFHIRAIEVQKLPDVSPLAAVSYGVLAALAIRGWERPFNFHWLDALVIGLTIHKIVAAVVVEYVWTGVSSAGQQMLEIVVPYFMGRAVFCDRHHRLRAAQVIAALSIPIAFIALVEMRFKPLFFSRFLKDLGLSQVAWDAILPRFGLFRAQSTFAHPIDLGNGGALMLCILTVLAATSGRKLTTPWVAIGVACGVTMILASMSFTSYVSVAAIGLIFVLMRFVRVGAFMLIPIGVAALVGYGWLTYSFVTDPLDMPTWEQIESGEVSQAEGSFNTRHLIVQSVWLGYNEAGPSARTAGYFGWGRLWDVKKDFGLLSIDNSYLLFVIDDGWGYLLMFLGLGFALCFMATRAALRINDGPSRTPLAAGVGGIVGTMLGMYTVFFGFVYAQLFIVLMGLVVSMIQNVFERTGEAPPAPAAGTGSGGAFES
jgi:hypothetical protein